MAYPHIKWSILAQLAFGLLVHGINYFSGVESANVLEPESLGGFVEVLTMGSFFAVAFYEIFPGQFWIYLALPLFAVACLFKSRGKERRMLWMIVFHIVSAIWILFPILAGIFGDYHGP